MPQGTSAFSPDIIGLASSPHGAIYPDTGAFTEDLSHHMLATKQGNSYLTLYTCILPHM